MTAEIQAQPTTGTEPCTCPAGFELASDCPNCRANLALRAQGFEHGYRAPGSFAVCRSCGFTNNQHSAACRARVQPFQVPPVPAELEALMPGFSDADAGRILRSQRLGHGYLGSDFDSPAAGLVSAVMCHLHRALNLADTYARQGYHRDMAAGYVRLALTEAAR